MIYEEFVYKTCARLLAGGRDGGDQRADGVCGWIDDRYVAGCDDKRYDGDGGNSDFEFR